MRHWLDYLAGDLALTPQDPLWHGEGDVLSHTEAVCAALESLPEYLSADAETRKILYLAALFHDVGKLRCTRMEDGRCISPGHARAGAHMTRQLLWQEHALCGDEAARRQREAVCGLIRYHSLPLHAINEPDGRLRLMRFAANGALAPQLTVKNLCTLATADIMGRICPDREELLERVELCRELAREAGCYEAPYPFPTAHTRFSWLSGMSIPADYPLYDDSRCQVILMSALPGTGKDTWIEGHYPHLPMLSLDNIRKRLSVSPKDSQGRVLQAADEQAREYLRKGQSFVWNATNLSTMVRGSRMSLFGSYGAAVRIVYLETDWETQLSRNENREDSVPLSALNDMLGILSPPEMHEARHVHWHTV